MNSKRRSMNRMQAELIEAAASRRAAGISSAGKVPTAECEARMAEIPDEQRDLTGRMFGDPPPRDPRRTWAPHLAGDA